MTTLAQHDLSLKARVLGTSSTAKEAEERLARYLRENDYTGIASVCEHAPTGGFVVRAVGTRYSPL